MALIGRSTNDIINEAIRELRNNTAITRFTPGAKARSLLRAMAKMVGGMHRIFEFDQALSFVSGASGIYLDFIGELLGVERLAASQARVDAQENNVRFYTLEDSFGAINGGLSIKVPANTVIQTNGGRSQYRTVREEARPSGSSSSFVSVEAVQEGPIANVGQNALRVHAFTAYADSANDTLLVTNDSPIDAGHAVESDDLYRFRIMNTARGSENANSMAVRLAALSIPSVSDVFILEYRRGIGTSNILLKSVTGKVTQEMIEQVQAAVEAVKAHSSHFIVEAPEEIGVQLEMSLSYRSGTRDSDKSEIERDIERAVRAHVMGLDIGESLIINELIQIVMETDDRIRDMGTPGKPFDDIFVFRPGLNSADRIRSRLLQNYLTESDQKLILEESVAKPVVIRRS